MMGSQLRAQNRELNWVGLRGALSCYGVCPPSSSLFGGLAPIKRGADAWCIEPESKVLLGDLDGVIIVQVR
jgi:hypothetical protein